jgi:aldehyde:ferredoxin oxidoreductase
VVVGETDATYGGPEYETLASIGSNCGVDNLEAIVKGNALCNAYGLDTISTGVCIAFAMECFENGILTEKDTNGLKLNFGNALAMVQLVEMIAHREGIGNILADGVARAAQALGNGAENYAMEIKGQEIPMHEPRYKPGLGVGYTVSPTGADHCHNVHDTMYSDKVSANLQSLGVTQPIPAQELNAAKVRALVYGTLWQHTLNCLVWCSFVPLGVNKMIDLLRGITGWNTTVWELMKVGERCVTMTHVFNLREGFEKKDDYLPKRFYRALTSGPLKGARIKQREMKQAIDTYYDMVGWDRKSGKPARHKLQELGIEWLTEETSHLVKGG